MDANSATTASSAPAASGPSYFEVVYPLTILILLGLAIPALLMSLNAILSRFAIGTRNTSAGKIEQYESGLPVSVGTSGEKFSIKFYLIAMLFLAFDIEVAFLYPWAYMLTKSTGWGIVWLLVVFLVLLEVGYLYLYKKGALDWE